MLTLKHGKSTAPQREFWASPAKFRLFVGGVGSGKTRAGVVECLRQPTGSRGMVVAPTYPMLRDATLHSFLEVAERGRILRSFSKSEMRAELLGGREILFRSGDKPDRLRGPNIGWFFLDEAAMLKPLVWKLMIGRLRLAPGRAWASSTPAGKNWLFSEFVTNANARHFVVKASTLSNPYNDPDFVASLISSYDHAMRLQEVEGEWLDDSQGTLIPEAWLDRACAAKREAPSGRVRVAIDLGEGTGRDWSAIFAGTADALLETWSSNRCDFAAVAKEVNRLAVKWNVEPEDIIFDAGGKGKDFPPYLEAYQIFDPTPYHGSGSGGPNFANKRSRSAWRLRRRLDPELPLVKDEAPPPTRSTVWTAPPIAKPAKVQKPYTLPIDQNLPRLLQELRGLKYSLEGREVTLEKKEELTARLGRSPDFADAMLMLFSKDW